MTKRQPKGTPVGGQFAEDKTPAGPDLHGGSLPDYTLGPADDEDFVYETSPDGDPDQKNDRRFFNCGECEKVVNDTICPNCGCLTRSISGTSAREMGLLDDEPSESMLCTECGQIVGYDDSHTLQHLANGEWDFESDGDHAPVASGSNDDFVSSVSDEDKQRYVNSITAMYEEFASMGLEADSSRYLPNERGFQLLSDSSFKITGELETSNGVAWTAILKMDGKTINVDNRGDGGSNWYSLEGGGGGWKLEAELNILVTRGFPGLGAEAIDDFCSILEVAHEGAPQ